MQVELKFLLDANAHFQGAGSKDGASDDAHLDDLQAVDRALPDPDWFELGDHPEPVRRAAGELWEEGRPTLEF